MGKLTYATFTLMACTMLSCDPGYLCEFKLHNKTEKTLEVTYSTQDFIDSSCTVPGNDTYDLYAYGDIGGDTGNLDQDAFERVFLRITLQDADSIFYESDPAKVIDWRIDYTDGWLSTSRMYTLTLNNRLRK